MKKRAFARSFFLLGMILMLCVACEEKTRISRLLFNEDITRAYLDEEAFTGRAWSEDEKTICLECENGAVKQITVYHANGKVALQNTKLAGTGQSYDTEGNAISMEDFMTKYPELIGEIQLMVDNMYCTPDLE